MPTFEVTTDIRRRLHVKLEPQITIVANTPTEVGAAIDHYLFGHQYSGRNNSCPACRWQDEQQCQREGEQG